MDGWMDHDFLVTAPSDSITKEDARWDPGWPVHLVTATPRRRPDGTHVASPVHSLETKGPFALLVSPSIRLTLVETAKGYHLDGQYRGKAFLKNENGPEPDGGWTAGRMGDRKFFQTKPVGGGARGWTDG